MYLTCGLTGHRPDAFPFGYDEASSGCRRLKAALAQELAVLARGNVGRFLSGMAQGVDTWAVESLLLLREEVPELQITAVLPCAGQASRWPQAQRERHEGLLAQCDGQVLLREQYGPGCMLERDRWLVDHADLVLAVYDGRQRGGTAYTVRYAGNQGKPLILLDPHTLAVSHL